MSSFNSNNKRGVTRLYDYDNGQKVSVSDTSAQSAAITGDEVLLHATVALYLKVGADPTAANAADNIPMAAGEKFHIRVRSGEKVAAIRDSEDGALFIVPITDT